MWRILVLLAACSEPHYTSGRLRCAASGRACPEGLYCASDGVCWSIGSGPDLAAVEGVDMSGVDLAQPDLASPVDLAGKDAVPPSLCPGSFKICDDFEAASIDGRYTIDLHGGTATVDDTRSYRGGQSLHLHTNPQATANFGPYANLVTYSMQPLTGTAFARAWVYIPSTNPGQFFQILNFANAGGAGTSFSVKNGYPVLNDYAVPNSYAESTTFPIPTDRWTCIALQVSQSGANGPVKLFLDDAEVTDVSFANATTPTMTHIYVGLDFSGNPAGFPATDMWLDELVIHDQPVSCFE